MSKHLRQFFPFFILLLLTLSLRIYRVSVLTTYGRDQGIDFQTVKQMIEERKPTLIGIQVSLAEFHQGPIYLYILVPLFIVLKFDPIAGAYTAIYISLLTITTLYFVSKKYFGHKAALFSSVLFAVSPEFVREGNSPLYQHFQPLFVVIAVFTLLKLFESKERKLLWSLLLGFTVGICLELHFLAITFALALVILLLIQRQKPVWTIPSYLTGLLIGVSPTILFELRHEFLNVKLFLAYLSSSAGTSKPRSVVDFIFPWIDSQTKWFGADQLLLGLLLTLFFFLALFIRVKEPTQNILKKLLLLTLGITFFFQLGLHDFHAHYLLPVLVLELMLFPVWISALRQPYRLAAYVLCSVLILSNLVVVVKGLNADHGYSMPNGWSLSKIQNAASIIKDDTQNKKNLNVASLLDGDSRAYPLRYSLNVAGITVDSPENYSRSGTLYVVSKTSDAEINKSSLWEISSFQPFTITQQWDLGEEVRLYRLEKSI